MKKSALSLVALLAAGVLACDDAPYSGYSEIAAPDAVSSVAAEPPASAVVLSLDGATVDRFPVPEFLVHLDEARGLVAVHAPSDLCSVGFGALSVLEARSIDTPAQIEQFIFQTKGEATVAVYEADSFADTGIGGSFDVAGIVDLFAGDVGQFCAFLEGPSRIAEGTVRRVSNLSNASFAVTWVGELDLVAGGTVRLTESYQLTASAQNPGDESLWRVNVSNILLH